MKKLKFSRPRARNGAGTDVWHKIIEPYCRLAASNRGFIAETARRMQAAGFPTITQQQVRHWLVADRADRTEPRWGVGDVLITVLESMTGEGSSR